MLDLIYKLDKTTEDIETLLYAHKNLVYYMLTLSNQLTNQDAESAAWEALWDSIILFDVFSKTAFSTFACTIIKNSINTVLRKQLVDAKLVSCLYCEPLICEIEDEDESSFINEQFKDFIKDKTGIAKNILLAWHSSSFEASATNLSIMCKTSPSYVCRVQNTFRAFLSGKLKKL